MKTLTKLTLTLLVAATAAQAKPIGNKGIELVSDIKQENLTYNFDAATKKCDLTKSIFVQPETIAPWIQRNGCKVMTHKNIGNSYIVECKAAKEVKIYAFGATAKECNFAGNVASLTLKAKKGGN